MPMQTTNLPNGFGKKSFSIVTMLQQEQEEKKA
jgi:hypothetical protein